MFVFFVFSYGFPMVCPSFPMVLTTFLAHLWLHRSTRWPWRARALVGARLGAPDVEAAHSEAAASQRAQVDQIETSHDWEWFIPPIYGDLGNSLL